MSSFALIDVCSPVLDPGPVTGTARTPRVTEEQIQHQTWVGKKEKQGGRPETANLTRSESYWLAWSDATGTRKAAFSYSFSQVYWEDY